MFKQLAKAIALEVAYQRNNHDKRGYDRTDRAWFVTSRRLFDELGA